MTRWIALLRGVNVGGGNKVPMAELRALAECLGWQDVATYIASGNMVFSADGTDTALAEELRRSMAGGMGVDVPVLVLPAARMASDLAACPFRPQDPRHVHLMFLMGKPVLDEALLADLRTPSEALHVSDGTAYLHTPDGYGQSRLADKLGKVLGCDYTARNLRTVAKLVQMAGA